MLQVARIGIITAANSNPANSGQYYIDMFTRSAVAGDSIYILAIILPSLLQI